MFKGLLKLSCAFLLSIGVFFKAAGMDDCFPPNAWGDEAAEKYANHLRNIRWIRRHLGPTLNFFRFLNMTVNDVKNKKSGVNRYSNLEDLKKNECYNNECSREMKEWINKALRFDKWLPKYTKYVCGKVSDEGANSQVCMAVDPSNGFTHLFIETKNESPEVKRMFDNRVRKQIPFGYELFLRNFFIHGFDVYPGCAISDSGSDHALNCRGFFGYNPRIFDDGNEEELIKFIEE